MTECFNKRVIQLSNPIIERTGEIITHVNVPCGKCENCIKRRRQEWCFRLEEELKVSKTAYFITLTYDPMTVPYDKWGNKVLDNKDLTKFFKRLRINQKRCKKILRENFYRGLDNKKDKISYYACGEYGTERGRPHYHAIVFNTSTKMIEKSWVDKDGKPIGYIHIGTATSESIAYCTKYMDKWRDKKQDWKKPKEFNVQSEGLGKSFCEKMKQFYKTNLDINYVVNRNGTKIPMPRYYRLIMLEDDERMVQTGIIHRSVTLERLEGEHKLGFEEYHRRKKVKQDYVKTVFKKNMKKRDI